jgi:ETFB lysine methyltransferase
MIHEQSIELKLAGRTWLISKGKSLEDLWNEMTGDNEEDEDHIPYWTEVWPASKVLAQHIHASRSLLSGRLCLDIGCGLGITSLLAGSLGAKVVAMDFERQALECARKNARLNHVSALNWIQMDWRNPGLRPAVFDFIWGADILYETRFCQPLALLLKDSIRENGRIWIADPERNISAGIWSYFEDNGFIISEIKREKAFTGRHKAMVRLIELSV